MIVDAYAKLNLNVHLLPKKVNGLYPVRYVNCELSLADHLIFELEPESITVACTDPAVPQGERNLVFQAASVLKKQFGIKQGVHITIEKNIPVGAGLGGGSANAGCTLKALVKLWNLDISEAELVTLARPIGMDVCYCTVGGIAVVEHDGSQIHRLPVLAPDCVVLVVVPFDKKPSTGWSFAQLNEESIGKAVDVFFTLQEALIKGNMQQFYQSLHNDFEAPLTKYFPVLHHIKVDLRDCGARATILCGAGLAMAGFFDDRKRLESAKKKLSKVYQNVFEGKILRKINKP